MASRYWVGGTATWDGTAGTKWATTSGGAGGASIPTAADDVFFDAASGAVTVTLGSNANVALSINCTGFTGTLTGSSTITVSGNLTLVVGMTFSYTGTFTFNASGTIVSAGKSFTTLSLGGASTTYTFSDACVVTGNCTLGGSGTCTFNGSTLTIGGNMAIASTTGAGTTNITLNGTGSWTGSPALKNNLTINTAGTITISGSVAFDTGTFTRTAGTVVTTGSTLTVAASATLNSNGITWNNIAFSGSAPTYTLSSTLALSGTLTISSSGGTTTINGSGITCSGSLVTGTGTARIIDGTSNITLTGTGSYSGSSGTSATMRIPFTINTAGTITFTSGHSFAHGVGAITVVAGTVVTTGSSMTLSSSITVTGGTNVYWNNLTVNNAVTLTYGADLYVNGLFTVSTGGTLTAGIYQTYFKNALNNVVGSLLFIDTSSITVPHDMTVLDLRFGNAGNGPTINGSTIYVNQNLTVQNTANGSSGTTAIVMQGTGTWSSSGGQIGNSLTFNTAGTITISGSVFYQGVMTRVAGTVNAAGSTMTINGASTFDTAGMSFNNITINTTGTITINSLLSATGTLLFPVTNTTFAGTAGFSVGTMALTGVIAATRTITLVSGRTYTVNTAFNATGSSNTMRYSLVSSTPGVQAIFTLAPAATQNVLYVNATDIDSSAGQTVWSFQQVISNTLNWGNLNVSNIGGAGIFTFAN